RVAFKPMSALSAQGFDNFLRRQFVSSDSSVHIDSLSYYDYPQYRGKITSAHMQKYRMKYAVLYV
ncbi:MAG: hypothetical protein OQL16_06280, partial [Gammaproteobacteria bacterium]|nr:hypothetical protein [Gammaproteobacteria bacterium]